MKRLALSLLATVAVAGTAAAADLPSRKVAPAFSPVMMPATWTGLYVGINGSYNFLGRDVNPRPDGFAIGARIGYDHQFASNVVVGVFADGDYAFGRKTSNFGTAAFLNRVRNSHEYTLSVNARLGYAFGPTLIYLTGGYSNAQFKFRNESGPLPGGPITVVSG
ncbi:MAG: outer membrane protein, partial [Beijerinckiaceae bacterium]